MEKKVLYGLSVYDKVMGEIESILRDSPYSDRHFEKSNNVFDRVKEIIMGQSIETKGKVGYFLWRYIRYIHKDWVQVSFEQKKDVDYTIRVRTKLLNKLFEFCRKNGIDENLESHLANLHNAVWHSLLNQHQFYCKKMNCIDSLYTQFKKYGN